MAKARGAPKTVTVALGYDAYTVERDGTQQVVRFEGPHIARIEHARNLAKIRRRKGTTVIDATRAAEGPLAPYAERMQLEWSGDHVTRAWLTAEETHAKRPDKHASELLALALEQPAFERVEEIGIGLEQWADSGKATLDRAVDVLATKRPRLRALALGDYTNEGGHVTKLGHADAIARLYPALERLRITTTKLCSLARATFPQLVALSLRGVDHDRAAFAALDRAWPALETLAIGWERPGSAAETLDAWSWLVAGERTPVLRDLVITGSAIHGTLLAALVTSPLLPRLRTLDLRGLSEVSLIAQTLRGNVAAFTHLESLVLPDDIQILGLAESGIRVTYREQPGRYGSSME